MPSKPLIIEYRMMDCDEWLFFEFCNEPEIGLRVLELRLRNPNLFYRERESSYEEGVRERLRERLLKIIRADKELRVAPMKRAKKGTR